MRFLGLRLDKLSQNEGLAHMRRRPRVGMVVGAALMLAVPMVAASTASAQNSGGGTNRHLGAPVCQGPSGPATASCHARLVVPAGGATPKVSSSPYGLSPAQIKAAYGWTSIGTGSGKTIAIVDA